MKIAEGEKMKQDFEIGREETFLGMQQGTTAAANQAARNAQLAQQQAEAAERSAIYGGIGDVAGAIIGAAPTSIPSSINFGDQLPEGHYESDYQMSGVYDPNRKDQE